MDLRLKYEPTTENASLFAADTVAAAKEISGVTLDYSPESLAFVDAIIGSFEEDGVPLEQVKETLFGFGCYVGEVFIRSGNGRWRSPKEGAEQDLFSFPLVVEIGPENVCNPIGKVFKRLEYGESENLPYFFSVFAAERPRKRSWFSKLLGR